MTTRPAALGMAALLLPLLGACGTTDAETDEPVAMAVAELSSAATLALACSGCHSPAGGAITSLDGRTAAEIKAPLIRYHAEADGTSVMHRMMRGYTEADIDAISTYLAGSTTE